MPADSPTPDANPSRNAVRASSSGTTRQVIDAIVCLSIAVILFRGFEIEGYMISTGSMAPSLLGFHKRVVCPSCGFHYTFGVAFDDLPENEPPADDRSKESTSSALAQAGSDSKESPLPAMHARQLTTCPNCGEAGIDIAEIPRNQGDQLLVNKSAYQFAKPQRWEVVVFRNPYKATQAYVKRAIGLPGERIQLLHGDVYADGQICRKGIEAQRSMRITVFDNNFVPTDDPHWQTRWVPDKGTTPWKSSEHGFVIDRSQEESREGPVDGFVGLGGEPPAGDATVQVEPELLWSWTTYHHGCRSGGTYRTVVDLDPAAGEFRIPEPVLSPVRYDAAKRQLVCVGAMTQKRRDDLLAANPNSHANAAIHELYRQSHLSPVMDDYGYNQPDSGLEDVPVRDLMFTANVSLTGGTGSFVVEMTDGGQTFDCVLDLLHREARLYVDGGSTPLRTAPLAVDSLRTSLPMEMSLFDRQVIVTLNGTPLFEPLLLEELPKPPVELPRSPVRFGARGVRAEVQSLVLYRDVHYTRGRARNGVEEPYPLGPDEYFVLGDNSPVSADSRSWPDGAVPARLLVGKPFVVHLPSRPGRLQIGGKVRYIRIPDFERMRYIR